MSESENMNQSGRTGRVKRSRRKRTAPSLETTPSPARAGTEGGHLRPLTHQQLTEINTAVRHVLEHVGFSEAPPIMVETVLAGGGKLLENGRLSFPESLLEQFLANAKRGFTLHGQRSQFDIHMSGKKVHMGTGGAAPQVVDLESEQYRDSTLLDLYSAARLTDALDHIHFFSRSLVARDMPNPLLLDINTAYASLVGTQKHVCTSITLPNHVKPLSEMFYMIAGSKEAFEKRPFISLNINHVVPPLRFHAESCEVMAEAVKRGIPVHCNVFSQVGASCPVTLAGSIVQNTAESLAGMIFAWLINPNAKAIMGVRPMLTDLRTGGFSGGSGEQAIIMAATAQVAQFYDLPNSCIAGATDSKLADAQSGYEKSMTVSLAAQAGSNLITQAAGMHAGLMGVALESYVIDNEMLGGIMRSINPIEVNETTLATQMIAEVVNGEGHFLGHPETYNRMQTDFLYPEIADRRSPQEWETAGQKDIREIAKEKTKHLLATHYPNHISAEVDQMIRERFDIRLTREQMRRVE
ncbi:MAG: trimethylamine methyltransferase family protein [Chloroflexota bacterium]